MTAATADAAPARRRSFWDRELQTYPKPGTRLVCLGIVVLATIILYYQFYLAGAVATHILRDFDMSFTYYVNISVVGYVFGALASFATGFADRYGRANIISVGLLIVGLLCLVGIPNAGSKLTFGILFVLIGVVEGVILVATPAIIRDFSPQLGRASAMGFWTLGPVLGSLVVAIQVSATSDTTPWQDHYIAAGIVGIIAAVIAFFFLRELAPGLRDQLMVSARDRALIEARAKGVDVEASLRHPYRQMLKPDIILSSFAISVFLLIYYIAVGFFPIYFQTIFGFTQSTANELGDWNWAFNAAALLIIGFVSDFFRVRKPFMVIGAVGAIIFTIIFLTRATHPDTTYSNFVWILIGLSCCLGIAYAPWMASFTETVERRNPALVATGLSVWGLIIRIVIAVSVFFVPHVVNTVTTLVEKGPEVSAIANGEDPNLTAAQNATVKAVAADPTIVPKVQGLAAKYKNELATAAKIDPATQQALAANPNDVAAQAKAVSDISGVPVADVATIIQLNAAHGPALQAISKVNQSTLAALLANPNNRAAAASAVAQIVAGTPGTTPTQAVGYLNEVKTIPTAQLLLLQQSGTKVVTAAAQLKALAAVPAADLAYLNKYGPPLQDPKVQANLKFLQANAP
ncbi:MAG TPA: MFS transporter, partial [Jatrophihabitantaceae bacterium]